MNLATALSMVPGYVLQMRNDQLPASKAWNTQKAFQNNRFKIDTKGKEILPTMTHSYAIAGHVTRKDSLKQANLTNLEGHFLSAYISKVLRIHP